MCNKGKPKKFVYQFTKPVKQYVNYEGSWKHRTPEK